MFEKLRRKVYRAVHVHGLPSTGAMLLEALRSPRLQARSAFDAQWNVDTDGSVAIDDLEVIDSTHYRNAVRYQPVSVESFTAAMSTVVIPPNCTFVDLGCGKGRALLLAAGFPFRHIIGVDFAPELVAIANENSRRTGLTIETVCADAARYPLPPGPLLLFLFNPFDEVVMERVVANAKLRSCIIVYCNPVYAHLWDASFKRIYTDRYFITWRSA